MGLESTRTSACASSPALRRRVRAAVARRSEASETAKQRNGEWRRSDSVTETCKHSCNRGRYYTNLNKTENTVSRAGLIITRVSRSAAVDEYIAAVWAEL